MKFFEERLYMPVSTTVMKISNLIFNLHKGDVDKYIVYAFAAIVIIFFLVGWLA